MSDISASQVLMPLTDYRVGEVVFKPAIDGEGDLLDQRQVRLPLDSWEDLGRPQMITVTIEPGDTLNE